MTTPAELRAQAEQARQDGRLTFLSEIDSTKETK